MSAPYAAGAPYEPLLQRFPDGRRAPLPVLSPVFLGYIALILGAPVASACALYNAAVLRRAGLAVVAALTGVTTWLLFTPAVELLLALGLENITLVITLMRLAAILVGVGLALQQMPHYRGHLDLDGLEVPLTKAVVAGYVLMMILPQHILLLLLGLR